MGVFVWVLGFVVFFAFGWFIGEVELFIWELRSVFECEKRIARWGYRFLCFLTCFILGESGVLGVVKCMLFRKFFFVYVNFFFIFCFRKK